MLEINYVQSIFDFVSNNVVIGVILIVVLALVYIFTHTKFGEYFIEKNFSKKSSKKEDVPVIIDVPQTQITISKSDILNNNFFNYIDIWVLNKIPTLEFNTEFRTAVFRRYLKIYLQSYKNNFKKFIEDDKYENMDSNQLWNEILLLVNNIVKEYESECILEGIPLVVVEKMKQRNATHINLTIDLLDGICNTGYYNSPKNRLIIISSMDIILSLLDNTISNSVDVCNSINGQLANLKFEGYVEPPSKHK